MNKSRFRTVSILIVVSLTALAVMQGVWMARMYRDMNRQFSDRVSAALEKAAYDALISRRNTPEVTYMQSNLSGVTTITQMDSSLLNIPIDSIRHIAIERTKANRGQDSILKVYGGSTIDSSKITIQVRDSTLKGRSTVIMNVLSSSDNPKSSNVTLCDSLLRENLYQAGIDLPHRLSLVSNLLGSEVFSLGEEEISNPQVFELPAGGSMTYRLQIQNPNRKFRRDMAGILFSSVLIVSLLILSFVYLLRTLFRQKSLEQMRMDFTHNITHELKTPIAVASAASEALIDFGGGNNPEKRDEYLRVIDGQLKRLESMVERILSTSVYENAEFRLLLSETELRPLFDKLAGNFKAIRERSVKIDVSVKPENLTLRCDPAHFSGVVGNLLDNAVKYTPGAVLISLTAEQCDGGVRVTVSDNGPGIPQALQERIFDKFYRAPQGNLHDVKGYGLGLYYVRTIVEKHKGAISVKSAPGKGTVFTIFIPQDEK